MAAHDRYGEGFDVCCRLANDGNEEEITASIAVLFGESVSHNGGNVEEDGIISEEVCMGFGDNAHREI